MQDIQLFLGFFSIWDDNMMMGQGQALRSHIYVCVACTHVCSCMWSPDIDFGGLSLTPFHLIF